MDARELNKGGQMCLIFLSWLPVLLSHCFLLCLFIIILTSFMSNYFFCQHFFFGKVAYVGRWRLASGTATVPLLSSQLTLQAVLLVIPPSKPPHLGQFSLAILKSRMVKKNSYLFMLQLHNHHLWLHLGLQNRLAKILCTLSFAMSSPIFTLLSSNCPPWVS